MESFAKIGGDGIASAIARVSSFIIPSYKNYTLTALCICRENVAGTNVANAMVRMVSVTKLPTETTAYRC